jgi:hypothetical protein
VTRKVLSDLLNGRSVVSPEMAIRLEKAGRSTADAWLRMQASYSLWQRESRRTRSRSADFPDLGPHSLFFGEWAAKLGATRRAERKTHLLDGGEL